MPDITTIAPSLFRVGSLLTVTFGGPWNGEVTVKDRDKQLVGFMQDSPYVKKGQLMLMPKTNLKPFENVKRKVAKRLDTVSRPFIEELPQIRLVNNNEIPAIDAYLREMRDEYLEVARVYIENHFQNDVLQRKSELVAKFPGFADRIDAYYLSPATAHMRCHMRHMFFKIEDVEGLDTLMATQKQELTNSMTNLVQTMASDFRQTAVDAAIAFKEGMDGAETTVNQRSIKKFKGFLERFEHLDFLGDTAMKELLGSIRENIHSVGDWSIKGNEMAHQQIREHLDAVVKLGKQEGGALEVADRFCRSSSAHDVEIEIDSEDSGMGQANRPTTAAGNDVVALREKAGTANRDVGA